MIGVYLRCLFRKKFEKNGFFLSLPTSGRKTRFVHQKSGVEHLTMILGGNLQNVPPTQIVIKTGLVPVTVLYLDKITFFDIWHQRHTSSWRFQYYSSLLGLDISGFDRNFNFWPKFQFLSQILSFLTKILIFHSNLNFLPKFWVLTKI